MKLHYKGYDATVRRDSSSRIWHGRISNIKDVVAFEGNTEVAAATEFRKAVDAYLNFCHRIGHSPHPPAFLDSPVALVEQHFLPE
jgi:predicted HicB family RNase H-like nuclease